MSNLKKKKAGGRKNGEGGRTTKNTKKKEKQSRNIYSQKGSRKKEENIERGKVKSSVCNNTRSKKNTKGKNKKGGQYVYFPDKNVIQFLPYSYKNISNNRIYNQLYTGNQAGGDILPKVCSNFTPNMLNREFNCQQPFWNENCV